MSVEDVSDARDVTVSMYISKAELVERARVIIERRVAAVLLSGVVESEGVVEADVTNSLYELGVRYFTQYASANWKLFLNHKGQVYVSSLEDELAHLDALIRELADGEQGRGFYVQLGNHLLAKARIESVIKEIHQVMLSLIEGRYFRSHILQSVIKMYHVLTALPRNPFLAKK